MRHFAIQAHDGEKLLPRKIISTEYLHDAERIYCEHLGLDRRGIYYKADPGIRGAPYWVETDETYEDDWDLQ